MTTVAAPARLVTGGVDTHLDVHVAAALDPLGALLGTAQFHAFAAGYRQLLAWLRSFGDIGRVGVEGTGSYGAALARHLTSSGVDVVEVSRPNRQVRRRHGKTDTVDAIAAARAVMSGEASATPKTHNGSVESLRVLKVLQRSANKSRTQAINQLKSLLVTAPPELRAKLQHLSMRDLLTACAAFRVAADDRHPGRPHAVRSARPRSAHPVPRRTPGPDRATAAAHHHRCRPRARRAARSRTRHRLHAAHHRRRQPRAAGQRAVLRCPHRLQPHPCQQRQGHRHRLNRGGDRQANSALWRIAIVRMASDERSKKYIAKRVSEGKSKIEAIRCLKRYIAREVFAALPQPAAA